MSTRSRHIATNALEVRLLTDFHSPLEVDHIPHSRGRAHVHQFSSRFARAGDFRTLRRNQQTYNKSSGSGLSQDPSLQGSPTGSFSFSASTKRACKVISFFDPSSRTRTRWRVPPDPRTTPSRPAILGPAAAFTTIRCPFTSSFLTSVRSSKFGRLRLFGGGIAEISQLGRSCFCRIFGTTLFFSMMEM